MTDGRAPALRRALACLCAPTALVVATEFIVVGLLPLLARDLDLNFVQAGLLTGVFAVSAALLGPVLSLATAGQPPHRLLVATLLLFALGNAAIVAWPAYPVLLVARAVQGAVLPMFIGASAVVVSALADRERRGRALADANLGFTIGVLVAVPAGVLLAGGEDWQLPMLLLAALTLLAVLPLTGLPRPRLSPAPRVPVQVALLRDAGFRVHLLLSVAVFAAMFAAYTYLAAWLGTVLGFGPPGVAAALAGFGAAGILGNMLAARAADRHGLEATIIAVGVIAAAVVAATLLQARPVAAVALLLLWGVAHLAGVTLCQVRVTMAGSGATAFAMAMNIASANLGIAVGAFLGGTAIDHWGLASLGWTTATLAAVAAGIGLRLRRRPAVIGLPATPDCGRQR